MPHSDLCIHSLCGLPPQFHRKVIAQEAPLADVALDSPHLGRFAYTYTRVTCASGAQAWSSPVWLLCG